MPTPYSTVFKSFLGKIQDTINYMGMEDADIEADMILLMNSAMVSFEYPKVNIEDKNDESKIFNVDLGSYEVEIIANLMTLEWTKRQLKSIDLIKQKMTDKDFKITSQAAHLEALIKLKDMTEKDCEKLKNKYSYKTSYRVPNFSKLAGDSND
jgi:hypothetical protein